MLNPWLIGAGVVGLGYWFTKKVPLDSQFRGFNIHLIPGPAGTVWMVGKNGAIVAQGTEATTAFARDMAKRKADDLADALMRKGG